MRIEGLSVSRDEEHDCYLVGLSVYPTDDFTPRAEFIVRLPYDPAATFEDLRKAAGHAAHEVCRAFLRHESPA